MIELEHRFPEPDALRQHRRQHPRGDWADPAVELLRPVLQRQLNSETLGILGLNVPALAWQRKGFADALHSLSDPTDSDEFLATIPFRWSLRGC